MKGYFQLALGRKYIEESVQFISSIRAFGDDLPVSILVKKEDHEYALSRNIFDHVIIFSENEPLFGLCGNNFEKYCLFPRLKLLDYIPYRECIVIDTDVLCIYSADKAWDTFRDKGQPFNCVGGYYDPSYHWSRIDEINEKLQTNINCAHGGIFYINKDFGIKELETFFLHLLYAFVNYDKLGFFRGFEDRDNIAGAMTDEILFGYALSKMNFNLLTYELYPIITFEIAGYLADKLIIPHYIQTWKWFSTHHETIGKDKPIETKDPIPFVHCFGDEKQKKQSYQKIKSVISELQGPRFQVLR
jgi:hypothetical protein